MNIISSTGRRKDSKKIHRTRHNPYLCDAVRRRDAGGRGNGRDCWICPTQWMPGHLNRETRRLRLCRGGGAWESPSVRLSSDFSFSVHADSRGKPLYDALLPDALPSSARTLDIRPKVSAASIGSTPTRIVARETPFPG